MKRIDSAAYRARHMTRADYVLFGAIATAKRGVDLPHAKLDVVKVRYVRANPKGLTARQLALELGVHYRTVEKIRHGETWVIDLIKGE